MARVVVVGGGFGGTACAARLAKQGHVVTLLERADRLGGAVGFVEEAGFRWDTGPTQTALPAVVRDLFRKSGRPLDRVLDLEPVEGREHRFEDGSSVLLPFGSRGDQLDAVDEGLGPGLGPQWAAYADGFADAWDVLRRAYLERPYSAEHVDRQTKALLYTRNTMHRAVGRAFKDERLRALALSAVLVDGHDPRNVPAWLGMMAYVERSFGVWTVPGGMGNLASAMAARLVERRVDVRLGTAAEDIVLRDDLPVGVSTEAGLVEADVVVCAIDPRRLPVLAPLVRRTMPAMPPVICHLGLRGDVPDLADEVVLHGDPTIVVRTTGSAPEGGSAWTLLGRGRLAEDVVTALARRGVDVRGNIEVRIDRSPRQSVEDWGGSPYGVLWQGRSTLSQRLGATTPIQNVHCAGAHAAPGAGLPFVGLGAALVAQVLGQA